MSKRRGFTLIEVLVVVLLTAIVLAMVGGLLVFMTNSSRTLIAKSEEIMRVQSIETRIRDIAKNEGVLVLSDRIKLRAFHESYDSNKDGSDDILYINAEGEVQVLFEDTGLFSISFGSVSPNQKNGENDETEFIECRLRFNNDAEYNFILGKKP